MEGVEGSSGVHSIMVASVQHKTKAPQKVGNTNIIITQTGLNLVKSFFKYIELLSILRGFNFEIMLSLFRVFNFYLFSVFHIFGNEESQAELFNEETASLLEEWKEVSKGQKSKVMETLFNQVML